MFSTDRLQELRQRATTRQTVKVIAEDFRVNHGEPRSQRILLWFRVCQFLCVRFAHFRILTRLVEALYARRVAWRFGVELPLSTSVGRRLRIFHAQNIVINPHAVLGNDVTIRHSLTIGHGREGMDVPTVCDGAELGAGVIAIGAITIGEGSRVGAGALVVSDVPARATVIGPSAAQRLPKADDSGWTAGS